MDDRIEYSLSRFLMSLLVSKYHIRESVRMNESMNRTNLKRRKRMKIDGDGILFGFIRAGLNMPLSGR